ncbi:hypothetical protein TBLA_0A02600 [Henningerozyma blattae CBS 6284]|uniref:Vacuolar protein sorting-associated protein 17 n=1 Tax=Henningerozyma blattae (strain ATCC 34711 / CBS 6284 / DSM 70876 / NBRC 10599 / NRRL Y-10934 / UCD 77-7) TaxID=1071380 RepID=I2GVA7_HENB6|nr:hypothetical protein TBLA_0A02600 [Tetrapisispora blattae CBS 6284]CCH58059.1 hypothetical protein TBLA_0A02600 [Tetrapisispora blattae CBS 6284]
MSFGNDIFDDMDNNPFAEPSEETPVLEQETTTDTVESGTAEPPNNTNDNNDTNINSTPNETTPVTTPGNEPPVRKEEPPQPDLETTLLPERKEPKLSLKVRVTKIERAGTTSNQQENPSIIFDVSTNIPTFRRKLYRNIKKTYEEFNNFFKYLNGSLPESFIPSIPPPYTNYGIENHEDFAKLLKNFQEWFNRIAMDQLILRKEELAFFIESDHSTYIPISKYKLPATGLKRKTLKQLSPPYDEVIELSEFRPYVKSLHWISKDLQSKIVKSSRSRKSLGTNESNFGHGFMALKDLNQIKQNSNSVNKTNTASNAENQLYKRFGKVINAVGNIDSIIATLDMSTLYDGLEWIVKDTYVVKEALTNRHLIMRELLNAQSNTKNKQETAKKFRSKRDINPLKVDESYRQLKEASDYEKKLTFKLQRITLNLKYEKENWLNWYKKKLHQSIKEYTVQKINYERKKLTILEKIRNDVRKADPNGGLSRLGRENLIINDNKEADDSNRNNGLTTSISSQGVEGDSWAGETRRRSIMEADRLNRTEFDDSINGTDQNEPDNEDDEDNISGDLTATATTTTTTTPTGKMDESLMNARDAATLLGTATF